MRPLFNVCKIFMQISSLYDFMNLIKRMERNILRRVKAEALDLPCLHMTSAPTP